MKRQQDLFPTAKAPSTRRLKRDAPAIPEAARARIRDLVLEEVGLCATWNPDNGLMLPIIISDAFARYVAEREQIHD